MGDEGWRHNVIGRLATDLCAMFLQMKGVSRANPFYMRRFAGSGRRKQLSNKLSDSCRRGHITVLLDRFDDHELRDWYAGQAAAHGSSGNVLEHQIRSDAHTGLQATPTNFAEALTLGDSDLAQQITKGPSTPRCTGCSSRIFTSASASYGAPPRGSPKLAGW